MREIVLYGPIEPGMSGLIVAELDRLARGKGDITVRINSPGGHVGEGIAIYNAIRKHRDQVVCTVEGVAYSMASAIALAGRQTNAYELAQIMIHDPSLEAYGGTRELEAALGALRAATVTLVAAYTAKSGRDEAEIREKMAATTFFSAAEAKAFGFVDQILGDKALPVAANFDAVAWARYHTNGGPVPAPLAATAASEAAATIAEIRLACPQVSNDFIVRAVEGGWTVARAQAEHAKDLVSQLAAVTAERDQLRSNQRPGIDGLGVAALGAGTDTERDGCPIVAWEEAMSSRLDRGMTRAQAVSDIARTEPEIRTAYVEACNAPNSTLPIGRGL